MIRALGSICVAAGAAAWGYQAASGLKKRLRALDDLIAGLTLLEGELSRSAPELASLMENLSRRSRGAARGLFGDYAHALERLGEASAAALWEGAVTNRTELTGEGKFLLAALGEVLGRYDCEEQRLAVRAVRSRLEELRRREGEDCRLRCRTCQTVALSGGAFLIILLL